MCSPRQPGRPFRSRKWLIIATAFLGLLGVLAAIATAFPQQILCVESGNVQADAIVLLRGGMGERPIRAAALFAEHAAPSVFVSGAGDDVDNCRLLVNRGIPHEALRVEPSSINTSQNARLTVPLLRAVGAKRVIIVTSWYHSRRALLCFRHYAPEIQFYSRPAYFAYDPASRPRQVNGYIRAEYVKLIGYWVRYGIARSEAARPRTTDHEATPFCFRRVVPSPVIL